MDMNDLMVCSLGHVLTCLYPACEKGEDFGLLLSTTDLESCLLEELESRDCLPIKISVSCVWELQELLLMSDLVSCLLDGLQGLADGLAMKVPVSCVWELHGLVDIDDEIGWKVSGD